MKKIFATLIIFFLALVPAQLKLVEYPFCLILIELITIIIYLVIKIKVDFLQTIFITLISILSVLLAFEGYYSINNYKFKKELKLTYSKGFKIIDEYGNPGFNKDFTCRSIKTLGDSLIYDAIYTTDEFGLRITPHLNKDSSKNVLFLGCSYVFGDGLMNNETLPYHFSQISKGKYNSYNFGMSGLGAYHMLNYVIKSNKYLKVIDNQTPHIVIFTSISAHINRNPEKATPFLERILSKSQLIRKLYCFGSSDENIKKYVSNIVEIRDTLIEKHNAQFYVLYWDNSFRSISGNKSSNSTQLIHEFQRNNITPIVVERDIFSKYKDIKSDYHINKYDHPSSIANYRIAMYLLNIVDSINIEK